MTRLKPSLVLLLAAGSVTLSGQRVLVYSEFQRVGPDGEVVKADRVDQRREILSPAVARNAYATFRVAVEAPNGSPYTLHIAQNPDDSARVSIYQEEYSKVGDEWIPEKVKPLVQPVNAVLSNGQKVQTYLLDMFVPESTPESRFRIEIQLWSMERWVIYPMEVRVRQILGPGPVFPRGTLPPASARADTAVMEAMRGYACAEPESTEKRALETVQAFIDRNARQDVAIARTRERQEPQDGVIWMLVKAGGWPTLKDFCSGKSAAPQGTEWWLRSRSYLYQGLPIQ